MRSFTSSNAWPPRELEPLASKASRVAGALLASRATRREATTRASSVRCSISRSRSMYGSGPRVATRYASAVGRKCRARIGSGLPVSAIDCEILFERGTLTALARRLRKDDALAHDQVALGLLHAGLDLSRARSGRDEEPREPGSRVVGLGLQLGLRLGSSRRAPAPAAARPRPRASAPARPGARPGARSLRGSRSASRRGDSPRARPLIPGRSARVLLFAG